MGSTASEIWGQSFPPPEANGGLGTEPPTLWRFLQLFPKIKHF